MKFPSPYNIDVLFSQSPKYNIRDTVTFFYEGWFTAKVISGKIIGISRKIQNGNIGYLVISPDKHNVLSVDEDKVISHESATVQS